MVLDASVVVELLINAPISHRIRQHLAAKPRPLNGPHLIDVEVTHVLRRHEARGIIDERLGNDALRSLGQFPLQRHPHNPLLRRVWELRHNMTAYDAMYVVLAEALDEPLLTRDQRLAASAGHRARIELI